MSGLLLKSISKSFGDLQVLDDISLELPEGELLVLLGPSGCGKTTLLRIIAGLEEADRGEIHIGSHRVDRLRPRDRNVALVFQNYSLYPHMTVAKNLAFPLSVAGVKRSEQRRRVQETAELLGLGDRLESRPGQLSGGQRQRVALGRAIIRDPNIFLLDEPLSNLDAELRTRMRQEIVTLQKRLGKTTVHVTHDQSEALSMADRVALLKDGRIQQLGPPRELYDNPANAFVAGFIGSPAINLFEGNVQENRLVPFGVLLEHYLVQHLADGGSLTVGLRPDQIEIVGDGEYTGSVLSSEYQGDQYVGKIEFRNLTLTVSRLTGPLEKGWTVRFSISTKSLLFFDGETGRRLSRVDE